MTSKPALPSGFGGDIPRIPVDEADGGDFYQILRIAELAAARWFTGPAGPYQHPEMTGAQRTRGVLREALLHLVELGLIEIDMDRLTAFQAPGIPIGRD